MRLTSMPKASAMAQHTENTHFIVDAAKALLAEVGYGAMSMRQLASRAGILPGSLYHHVTSKQDLLLLVVQDVLQARETAWRQAPRKRSLLGELKTFIRFVLAWQVAQPDAAKVLEHEYRHLDAHLKHWLAQRTRDLPSRLQDLLRRGQQARSLGDIDVESAALSIMALLGTADALRSSSPDWTASRLEAHFLQVSLRVLDVQKSSVPG